jgi:hypothetical protein
MLNISQINIKIITYNFHHQTLIKKINFNLLYENPIDIPEIPPIKNFINYFSTENFYVGSTNLIEAIQNIKDQLIKLKNKLINDFIKPDPTMYHQQIPRYIKQFDSNDNFFWGIGLENETYLRGEDLKISGKKIIPMLGRERYSVDYTTNYNIEEVKKVMGQIYLPNKNYNVANMINAHTLTRMDRNCQHMTTYEKEPKPNPKYTKSVIEEWYEFDEQIKNKLDYKSKTESNIFFDGDTIEFVTENFYKTNSENVVNELIANRKFFIEKFNKFKTDTKLWEDMGIIDYVHTHPGLNIFKSHGTKIVFFNNTTLHIHLTLPTKISSGIIIEPKLFEHIHCKAIRLLQWFEPFFICTLGSPDIMQTIYSLYEHKKNNSTFNSQNKFFARGSMRAVMSRYIGIGTFSTDNITWGKLLTDSVDMLKPSQVIWWRDMVKNDLLYNLPANEMGYDFNFGKHYQSGLEFRILDGIPMEILKDVIDVIILICEHSYSWDSIDLIVKPDKSQVWNNITYKSMVYGYDAKISIDEINELIKILNIPQDTLTNDSNESLDYKDEMKMEDFYYKILEKLFDKYNGTNQTKTKVIQFMSKNFTKINRWENFNETQELAHIKSLEPQS